MIATITLVTVIICGATTPQAPPNVTITTSQTIPTDYYNQSTPLPTDVDIIPYMESFTWDMIGMNYTENAFDCSQMSAYWEHILENAGYNTTLCYDDHHAWIIVDINGTSHAYETTGCYFITNDNNHPYYSPKYTYDSIYDCHKYYSQYGNFGEGLFMDEFAWWNSIN